MTPADAANSNGTAFANMRFFPGRRRNGNRREKKRGAGRPDNRHGRKASTHEKQEGKERVLTQGMPSAVTSIADAVVIKHDDLFLLTTPDGRVPLDGNHGFGLYYHDCRFLNGYEITVAGKALNGLAATAASGFMAVLQLTNPDLRTENGRLIP